MPLAIRGGVPHVFRATIDTAGRLHRPPAPSQFLQISNDGAEVLRVYFSQEDFDANANYIQLIASTGFYEGPAEIINLWFRAEAASTSVSAIFYARRG